MIQFCLLLLSLWQQILSSCRMMLCFKLYGMPLPAGTDIQNQIHKNHFARVISVSRWHSVWMWNVKEFKIKLRPKNLLGCARSSLGYEIVNKKPFIFQWSSGTLYFTDISSKTLGRLLDCLHDPKLQMTPNHFNNFYRGFIFNIFIV